MKTDLPRRELPLAPIGTVEPGWYPVSDEPGEQAYWDGRAWSIRRHRNGESWTYESMQGRAGTKARRGSSTRWGALALFAIVLGGAIAGGIVAMTHTNPATTGGGATQAAPSAGSGIKTLAHSSTAPGAVAPPPCTLTMTSELNPPGGQAPYTLTSTSASQPYSVEVSGNSTAATYAHSTLASGDSSGTVPVPNINVVNRYTVSVTFTHLSGSVSCSAYFYTAGN
jgi:hypothetical protein